MDCLGTGSRLVAGEGARAVGGRPVLSVGGVVEVVTRRRLALPAATFSDFKRRGFALQASQLDHAERLERLILIMALAMYWCVHAGRADAVQRLTVLEKKRKRNPTPTIGASESSTAAPSHGSNAGCVA